MGNYKKKKKTNPYLTLLLQPNFSLVWRVSIHSIAMTSHESWSVWNQRQLENLLNNL